MSPRCPEPGHCRARRMSPGQPAAPEYAARFWPPGGTTGAHQHRLGRCAKPAFGVAWVARPRSRASTELLLPSTRRLELRRLEALFAAVKHAFSSTDRGRDPDARLHSGHANRVLGSWDEMASTEPAQTNLHGQRASPLAPGPHRHASPRRGTHRRRPAPSRVASEAATSACSRAQ